MTQPIELKFKKLTADAVIPTYGTTGAACFDFYSTENGTVKNGDIKSSSYAFTPAAQVFSTGLSVEIPTGYALMIYSRSGSGFKNNVRLANCVGVIDSDYRGEIKIKLTADEAGRLVVKQGDRIAQGMIIAVPQVTLVEASELTDTERGTGGFGSTGQ